MTIVRTHADSIVWKKAISLASQIYSMTQSLAPCDPHTLGAQMRRTAISVASHLAEGSARGNRAEYIRFLDVARGSLAELETQICIGLELNLIDRGAQIEEEAAQLSRLLSSLHRRLREHRERARGFEPTGAPTVTAFHPLPPHRTDT